MFLLGVKKRISLLHEEPDKPDEQFMIKKKVHVYDAITIENINLPRISAKFSVPVKVYYFEISRNLESARLKFRLNESHAGCPRGEFEVLYRIAPDLLDFEVESHDKEKGDMVKMIFNRCYSRPQPCLECNKDYDPLFAELPPGFWENLIDFLKRKNKTE